MIETEDAKRYSKDMKTIRYVYRAALEPAEQSEAYHLSFTELLCLKPAHAKAKISGFHLMHSVPRSVQAGRYC